MAEHHHHHHHHKQDGASKFKQQSLRAIEFRKKFEKVLKYLLIALALVMAIALGLSYVLI